MTLNDKIRYTSRDLILVYVAFIKEKVDEKDKKFIKTGIDDSFCIYESLFLESVKRAVGSKRVKARRFPKRVISECIEVLCNKMKELGVLEFCQRNADIILDTCELIFSKIVEEVKASGYQVQ